MLATTDRMLDGQLPRAIVKLALFVVGALAALSPAHVRAEPELVLTWRTSAGCPDAAWAAERVRERLGRELTLHGDRTLHVDASLAHEGHQYRLTLRTGRGESGGDRTLTARDCGDLAEAAALMIALAIDARASAEERPAPQAARDTERPPGLVPEQPTAAGSRDRPRLFAVRAGVLTSLGDQPAWGIGPLLAFALEWSRVRAELAGYWLVPRTGSQTTRGEVRVTAWALRPTLCARLAGALHTLAACGGMELGRITGEGLGFSERLRDQLLWQAAFLGPRLSLRLPGELALVLEASAVAPFNRPRFVSVQAGETRPKQVYASAPVVGRATLGLEARF